MAAPMDGQPAPRSSIFTIVVIAVAVGVALVGGHYIWAQSRPALVILVGVGLVILGPALPRNP